MTFAPDPEILASLASGDATFALVQNGQIVHKVFGRGVGPALAALDEHPDLLRGAVVYDTIVGKAAAALFVLGGAQSVYAETISDAAVALLQEAGVACCWQTRTGQIINRRGDGLCPFEQAVLTCQTPEACLPVIRQTLARLRATSGPVK
mgnify:FL=1